MKVLFTINMPSAAGAPIHQILGEVYGCDSLSDVIEALNENGFVTVQEIYKTDDGPRVASDIVINRDVIGKFKEYRDAR